MIYNIYIIFSLINELDSPKYPSLFASSVKSIIFCVKIVRRDRNIFPQNVGVYHFIILINVSHLIQATKHFFSLSGKN